MVALMCYLQLSLWHIPGVVIVGNTIAGEAREVFYTPAHVLGGWNYRLARPGTAAVSEAPAPGASMVTTDAPSHTQNQSLPSPLGGQQAFDFGL